MTGRPMPLASRAMVSGRTIRSASAAATPGPSSATAAALAQGSLNTAAVTRRLRLARLFAGVLGGLFGFLYLVLRQETYALLSGTVVLFAVLSVVMAVTSRVDWTGRRVG